MVPSHRSHSPLHPLPGATPRLVLVLQRQECPPAPCHPSWLAPAREYQAPAAGPSLAHHRHTGLGKGSPRFCPQVVCQHYRRFGIPKDLQGVWRYLNSASETKEFTYTCPNSEEIVQAYRSVVRSPQ